MNITLITLIDLEFAVDLVLARKEVKKNNNKELTMTGRTE